MFVTQKHIDDYDRDGAVLVTGAFTEWVEPMNGALERVLAAWRKGDDLKPIPGAPTYGLRLDITEDFWGGPLLVGVTPYDQTFIDFAKNSPAGEILGSLMQSEYVRPWQDSFLVKEGDDALEHTKWHNDIEHSPFLGEKIAILWVALTDVSEENAPVVTVLGSHKGNIRYTHDEGELPPGYRPYQELLDIATAPDAPNRAWTMRAGDCLVMHFATIHSSLPRAKGAARRVGYSQRWLGDDVIYQSNRITKTFDPALTPADFEDPQVHAGVQFSFVNDEVIEMTQGAPPPDDSFPITWHRREPTTV